MKIGVVSRELGVPVPTVRRWCGEFGAGLTLAGRGGDGRVREFSGRDLRLLRRVQELLATPDMTFERARRELKVEGFLIAAEAPPAAPATADRAARRTAEEALRPHLERLDALEARLGKLEEELAALDRRLAELHALIHDLRSPEAPRRRWPFRQ